MPDGFDKTRAAQELFRGSAAEVVKLADTYTQHTLPDWINKTDTLGRLMGKDGVQAAKDYAQGLRDMQLQSETTAQVTGEELLPAFQDLNNAITDFWKENGPKFIEFLKRDFIPTIKDVIKDVGEVVRLATELSKSPIVTALLTQGVGGAAGVAGNNATGALNGLNQQMIDYFNNLYAQLSGATNGTSGGGGGGIGGGTPINGGQTVAPGGSAPITNNYTVNATYTTADPPTPAEITRGLTLINP
jgi:hypothetical protein